VKHTFALPDRMERIGPIVAGSDGNLWLAEQGFVGTREQIDTRVARLTPTGKFTSWTVNTDGFSIHGLAAASDGIWLTLGNREVGRISYSGQFTIFSHGILHDAFPDGITSGPDGAMWFAELGADAIGRIDGDGHVTQYFWSRQRVFSMTYGGDSAEPEGSPNLPGGADSIVSGADGTLWFDRPGMDELGRLSVMPRCSVPNLIGRAVASVGSLLRDAGCRLGHVTGRDRGFVVALQSIKAGSLLAYHAAIGIEGRSGHAARRDCVPDPSQRVVLADKQVSLLAALKPVEVSAEATPFRYFLCRVGSRGPYLAKSNEIRETLGGGASSGTRPGLLKLAGNYLVWQQQSTSYGNHWAAIRVLDTRTDRYKETSDLSPSQESDAATSIALDNAGRVAWLLGATGSSDRSLNTEEVQVLTPKGVLTLESGASGSLGSLTFSPGGLLHWTNGGQSHSYMFR
jgi:hypothetical protein